MFNELEKAQKTKGGQITAKARWGYSFALNHGKATVFRRDELMAKLSKTGVELVKKVSYIRNHDRERYV